MTSPDTNHAHAIALRALAWALHEPNRADRLLGLTGLDAESIRARIDDPALLAAVIDFLEGHEPDLVACADAISVTPHELLAIRAHL